MSKTYRTVSDLATIPVPAATATYCPVPQADVWPMVIEGVRSHGFSVREEWHQVHRKHPVFISRLSIEDTSRLRGGNIMRWEIGLINSYNHSKAIHMLFGATVFACTNGVIVADHILKTKHTARVWSRLPYMIMETMGHFEIQVNQAAMFYDRLKEVPFTRANLSDFAVRLASKGLLPRNKVVDLVEESMTPSFEYETRERQVLWNVHNSFTHLAKDLSPAERPSRVMGMERMMRDHYALV